MHVGDLVKVSSWNVRNELQVFNIGIIVGVLQDIDDCYYRIMFSDRITTHPNWVVALVI